MCVLCTDILADHARAQTQTHTHTPFFFLFLSPSLSRSLTLSLTFNLSCYLSHAFSPHILMHTDTNKHGFWYTGSFLEKALPFLERFPDEALSHKSSVIPLHTATARSLCLLQETRQSPGLLFCIGTCMVYVCVFV